jgi:hypothetical protein
VRTYRSLVLILVAAAALLAADVSGKWKASFTSSDGQTRESMLTLQADGEKLTGTMSGRTGESKIQDGTVKGDEITFVVVRNFNGDDIKFNYKGTVTGNKMALKVSAGDREFEMTATKE